PYLLEPPEVLGVMALTEAAMTLRLAVKVIPDEQWKIQRELLRRIKLELDESEIPRPLAAAAPAPPPVAPAPPSPGAPRHPLPPRRSPPLGRPPARAPGNRPPRAGAAGRRDNARCR